MIVLTSKIIKDIEIKNPSIHEVLDYDTGSFLDEIDVNANEQDIGLYLAMHYIQYGLLHQEISQDQYNMLVEMLEIGIDRIWDIENIVDEIFE